MNKYNITEHIINPIEEAGFKAYFVGGCVRDKLMGLEPHDYDVCTNATPEQLHKIFKEFSNISANSEKFGVTIPLILKEPVEIATFRKDKTSGRHPEVTLTDDINEDASRRDFTINALYEDSDGEIIDPTGQGIKDIENKKLRFVGSAKKRIEEDPLRAYRFVRFLATKNFKSAHSFAEIELSVKDVNYGDVSKERKLKEIEQIFAGKYFMEDSVQKYLHSTGLTGEIGIDGLECLLLLVEQSWKWHSEGSTWISPDGTTHLVVDKNSELDLEKWTPLTHGNAWDHTKYVMRNMRDLCWDGDKPKFDEHTRFKLMMAALLHDIGKGLSALGSKTSVVVLPTGRFSETIPKVSDHAEVGFPEAAMFCRSLGMSNDDIQFVSELVRLHMRAHQLVEMKSSYKIMRVTTHPFFKYLIILAKADENGCVKTVNDEWSGIEAALETENVKKCLVEKMPDPILTGDDLISYGMKPSPLFRKMLEKALEFQIDDGITDKEELYKRIKGIKLKDIKCLLRSEI